MPFLRVLRDKRGYETTYLMHWFREGNRQRSKILYFFRTPPGVRVGRDPIDPAIVREIEAQHPEIEFDWRALRENQQVIDATPEPRRPRRTRKEEKEKPPTEKPAAAQPKPEPGPAAGGSSSETPAQPRLVIPAAIEGNTREDQLVFLLKWYLNLRERVPHRTQDPIRREALRALVERLNPEVWVGEEAMEAGLKDAAEALQRLSTLFAKRRKRSRRSKTDRAGAGAVAGAPTAESSLVAETPMESDAVDTETVAHDAEGSEFESDSSE